jgi:hypothetical protein
MSEARTFSVAEVAESTGFARQSLHRAVRDGRLSRYVVRDEKGRIRLLPEAASAIRSGMLRLRVDTAAPPAPAPAPAEPEFDSRQAWSDIASWANALIDVAAWGPPPWSGEQWATLDLLIDQADDLAAEHGGQTPELLASLQAEGDE